MISPATPKEALQGFALVAIAALAIGTCTYAGYTLYTKHADSAFESSQQAACNTIGYRTGYVVEYDADQCWLTMEDGITLPWADARELIKFNYKRKGAQENGKTKENKPQR